MREEVHDDVHIRDVRHRVSAVDVGLDVGNLAVGGAIEDDDFSVLDLRVRDRVGHRATDGRPGNEVDVAEIDRVVFAEVGLEGLRGVVGVRDGDLELVIDVEAVLREDTRTILGGGYVGAEVLIVDGDRRGCVGSGCTVENGAANDASVFIARAVWPGRGDRQLLVDVWDVGDIHRHRGGRVEV